jgi:Tfp pilus assembly protein FimT
MRFAVPHHRINQGFTLVELLIGGVVSAIVLGSIAALAVHQIRIADRVYASTTIDRQFKRLSDLLKIEVGEACILRGDANPRTTATLPDTPCKPLATSNCTGAATTDLRLLLPVQNANNTISYNVVRYYLSGTELLRDGTEVNTAGQLTTTAATGSRILTNVSTFTPTVSANCTWVSLGVGLTVPKTTNVVTRTFTLYSGASQGIN